jgi:hypothetical protein
MTHSQPVVQASVDWLNVRIDCAKLGGAPFKVLSVIVNNG